MEKFALNREPISPGEILLEEFLKPMNMTQTDFAKHIGCDFKVINRIIKGRSRITADMSVRLAAALKTTPEFWLNGQQAIDIYKAMHSVSLPEPLMKSVGIS